MRADFVYALAGRLSEALLLALIVFSPWSFGATPPWAISMMNAAGWTLGALFLIRRVTRRAAGAEPQRAPAVRALEIITLLLLGYTALSAANASATYLASEWRLQELPHLRWLPHSFDKPSSWQMFWRCLALAGMFWAAYDWLSTSRRSSDSDLPSSISHPRLSSRLRLLLWVLSINGGLLALEAILQRASGTNELLWFMPTHTNKDAAAQLGPFAYRANGAQFLNLVWPVALGFWWWMHHDFTQRARRRNLHHVLIPCVIAMTAASLFSLSRGGIACTLLLLCACCAVFAVQRRSDPRARWAVAALAAVIVLSGLAISWPTLKQRLEQSKTDPLSGRGETYALAQQMARDYPWYGTGPGTFGPLFQLYRQSPEQYWPAQLHNDWLELRITYGRIGMGLILAALALAASRCVYARAGVPRDTAFLWMVGLALAGCLAHARFDFPFQIYSLQFLFLLLAAVLFSSRATSRVEERGSSAGD